LTVALRELIEILMALDVPSRRDIDSAKFKISRKYNMGRIPSNSELLSILTSEEREKLLPILRRKETRYLSGVNVVAVMTQPYPCPHGRCAYCPGGPDEGSPQSYTGHEPAAMRGSQNQFDPYLQVQSRIQQLQAIGHEVDKVDLIIMGGTFPASPREYQRNFVKGCLDAITGMHSKSFTEAKVNAESSLIRNVGITVETRPDCLEPSEVDWMLDLGVTRVEMGVQNVYEDIYQLVERGHSIQDVINGTRTLKDSALKICYHMMPGLPGSNFERDIEGFKKIFNDNDYMPDMLKIYPTLVVKGTKLYDWWKAGEYKPMETSEAVELVSQVKEMIPPWVRIMRVQRDIPLHQIEAGVDKSNLRQLAHIRLREMGKNCSCIRCREVGHRAKDGVYPDVEGLQIMSMSYEASKGIENFISVEDQENNVLIGFTRLRIPSEHTHRPEITSKTGLIRELHIYGRMNPVGQRIEDTWQHRGWGEELMAEAERIAVEDYDMNRMIVMSALGTKQYYSRIGYEKDGVYVSKSLE
jgi:elongator complex protein 3